MLKSKKHHTDLSEWNSKPISLVLSGGVVKAAAWHIGVGLALNELGFTFKHNESEEGSPLEISSYVGSSAGSLISLYLANGFSPMEIVQTYLGTKKSARLNPVKYRDFLYTKKPQQLSPKGNKYSPFEEFPIVLKTLLNPLLKFSGFFSTNGLKSYVEREVLKSNKFEDLKADLFVVATQLDHSRKVIFGKYKYPSPYHDSTAHYYQGVSLSDAVAASMALPPFYSPFPVYNPQTKQTDYYIDGEIRETLSTHVAIDNGAEVIISSWTHTPYHYHNEIGSLIHYGLPAICTQAIYLMIQKKIVSNRANRSKYRSILNVVSDYMKDNKFSNEHRRKILSILERQLNFNPNIQFIDICPNPEDYPVFFKNSFSLNPKKMAELVNLGYKRTMEVFEERAWEKSL